MSIKTAVTHRSTFPNTNCWVLDADLPRDSPRQKYWVHFCALAGNVPLTLTAMVVSGSFTFLDKTPQLVTYILAWLLFNGCTHKPHSPQNKISESYHFPVRWLQ